MNIFTLYKEEARKIIVKSNSNGCGAKCGSEAWRITIDKSITRGEYLPLDKKEKHAAIISACWEEGHPEWIAETGMGYRKDNAFGVEVKEALLNPVASS